MRACNVAKLLSLCVLLVVLAVPSARAQWIRAAYWDARYTSNWSGSGESMAGALSAAGYEILDADQLKTWMDARISDGALSVVVFCRDIAPDTVAESMSPACTLRNYLDAGGKCVWYGDIPFYWQGHPDGSWTWWGIDGSSAVLGFNAAAALWDTHNPAIITPTGAAWGLTETWASLRATSPDGLTVLATDSAGNALAWVKHYVTGDNYRGFVRLWDTADWIGGTPPVEDVISVAEYYGPTTKASAPSPANGATDVPTDVTLTWTPGVGAITHDIYFGTNQTDVATGTGDTYKCTVTDPSYIPGALAEGTTYYWRIDEFDGTATHKGDVWSFTTIAVVSPVATNPSPPDGATDVATDVVLTWTPGSGANSHHIYFGTNPTPGPDAYKGYVTEASYNPGPLANGTTYYWRIDEVEVDGVTTHPGDVWMFTTIAVVSPIATNPSPPDGATDVATDVALTWTAGSGANSHHIYFGTNPTPGTDEYKGYVTEASYNPGPLANSTTYYWRIDEVEVDGVTTHTGDVWRFTTIAVVAPPLSIPTDTSVGTWDPVTRIYTLTQDVSATLTIVEDNLTLDGNGHMVAGSGSIEWGVNGINANGRNHLTFQNLNVSNFAFGISLWSCSNCIVTGNNFSDNGWGGIWLVCSSNNTITGNTCESNTNNEYSWGDGIALAGTDTGTSSANIISNNVCNSNSVGISLLDSHYNTLSGNNASDNFWAIWFYSGYRIEGETLGCNYNTLTGNICNSNYGGIGFSYASHNTLSGNTCSLGDTGIYLIDCSDNTLSDNACNSNTNFGIQLVSGTLYVGNNNNTVAGNTISNNNLGIYLSLTIGDRIYNNSFIDNTTQAGDVGGSGNIFNLPKPIGGNFWSDWTGPNVDGDLFVDIPYVFSGVQDNYPWADQGGWLIEDSDGVSNDVENAAPNNGDGNNDGIPDSQQDNVTSLPNAADGQYVTIVSPSGTALENVAAIGNPSPDPIPPGLTFPVGFFEFTVSGLELGGSTIVTLILPSDVTVNSYWKYGPRPPNVPPRLYKFTRVGATGAEISPDGHLITLYLVDCQRGDDYLEAQDGRIDEPGGPAISLNEPPTADARGPYLTAVNQPCQFDGSGSSDPDPADVLSFEWDCGDGAVVAGEAPTHSYSTAGIYDVRLTVSDGQASDDDSTYAVVYDPSAGFVTGGGWIWSPAGAYAPDPMLEGKATFGFNSKYKKGATVPTGQTEFVFHAGGLNFHATSYDWLVVTGSKSANFKGTGTINGSGSYKFKLWARDDVKDTFRIKIWTEGEAGQESVVYDNGTDQIIGGGSIVVHTN